MSVYNLCFSPTGGTEKAANALCEGLAGTYFTISLLDSREDFSRHSFTPEDICVAAVPSFGGRVPAVAVERLSGMQGNGAKAVLLCVYGNRAYEDTLTELSDVMTAAGFTVAAAVVAIAEHSIVHAFAAGRPNREDEEELMGFGEKIMAKIMAGDQTVPQFPGERPYKIYKGAAARPQVSDACIRCGLCARECPVQAIPMENPATTDNTKCISCMRCIAVCPHGARFLPEAMVQGAYQKMAPVCTVRKENELYL